MKMSATLSLLLSLFLLIHTSNGYDITQILNKYPDFSTFNNYLTQTNLASTINARNTITVLVVDNANLAPLSSKSLDVIKNILSVHVLLDYYDVTKLQQLTNASPLPTTLFQTTGLAVGQQGFLNVTHPSPDTVTFGSAMPGSTQGSSLVKSVASEPYNISIIQISNAIIPQGIDGAKTSAPPSKSPATATPPPPAPVAATPPATATATPPPPAPATATATPPPPATATATPPPPAPVTATPPPPATTTATPPPPAPATATAPTKSSQAPPPSTTAPPTPSKGKIPPTSAPPTKAAAAPTMAATPSAAPGSASAPAPAASAPGASTEDTPTSDEPAGHKPAAKSIAASLKIGVAVVCTMALSTLYLASTI